MPPPIRKPDAERAQPSAADAINKALPLSAGFRAIAEQQARLRPGPGPGLRAALGTPVRPAPQPARSPTILYELGLTCVALRQRGDAIAALREAAALDPTHRAAWMKLGMLLQQEGDLAGAQDAAGKAAAATPIPSVTPIRPPQAASIVAAERDMRAQVKGLSPQVADIVLRDRLGRAPTDVAAMQVLAALLSERGRYPEAELLLQRALDLAPDHAALRYAYAVALYRHAKKALAIPQIERLRAHDPRHVGYRTLLGACLPGIGDFAGAAAIYEGLVKETPGNVDLWLSLGQALRSLGRQAEAVQAYRTGLACAPRSGKAYWSLINAQKEPLSADLCADISTHLAGTALADADRSLMHYTLGRALERAGDHAGSFAQYAQGARVQRSAVSYDAEDTTRQMRRNRSFFTEAFFAARAGWGCPDPAPIFIVGMPRAGSTLIEQILASHSAVEGTQELPEISHILMELCGSNGISADGAYPDSLASLDAREVAAFGERYIAQTRIYRNTDRPFFIDKMPANWVASGLIKLILPRAKIIDARRDPIGNCFGCFKQHFVTGQDFSYDLVELGRFYTDYVQLMTHFDAVLPGAIHRVHYEEMVADTEAQIRRLLNYAGLDFEPGCLRFWENTRAVSTISTEQVRRPIYRESVELWRNYEPWLTPLKTALDWETARP